MKLSVDDLGFRTTGKQLLDGVTLSIPDCSLTAVIGPNGAGKSTLLRIMAGDMSATTGSVRYDGEAVGDMPVGRRARVRAVLSQGHTADISFTVRQVVSMGRYPYRFDPHTGPETDADAVLEAIDALDLGALAHRQVRSLSGGEQQRVSIARVLAQRAPVVLLDEPTTALDIGHQESVMTLVKGLKPQGHTVVAVLHNLNMAAHFDQVVLLHEGKIVASGTPEDVLTGDILSTVYSHPIDVVGHPKRPGVLVLPRTAMPAAPDRPA